MIVQGHGINMEGQVELRGYVYVWFRGMDGFQFDTMDAGNQSVSFTTPALLSKETRAEGDRYRRTGGGCVTPLLRIRHTLSLPSTSRKY